MDRTDRRIFLPLLALLLGAAVSCSGPDSEKCQFYVDEGKWSDAIDICGAIAKDLGSDEGHTPPASGSNASNWIAAKVNLGTALLGDAGFDIRKFLDVAVAIQIGEDVNENGKLDTGEDLNGNKKIDKDVDTFSAIKAHVLGITETGKKAATFAEGVNAKLITLFTAQRHLEDVLYNTAKYSLDGRGTTEEVKNVGKTDTKSGVAANDCKVEDATAKTATPSKTTPRLQTEGTTTTTPTSTTTPTTTSGGACREYTSLTSEGRYRVDDAEFVLALVRMIRSIYQVTLMGLDDAIEDASGGKSAEDLGALPFCCRYQADVAEFDPFGKSAGKKNAYTISTAIDDVSSALSLFTNAYNLNFNNKGSSEVEEEGFGSAVAKVESQISGLKTGGVDTLCEQVDTVSTTLSSVLDGANLPTGLSVACPTDETTGDLTCTLSGTLDLSDKLGAAAALVGSASLALSIVIPVTIGEAGVPCSEELSSDTFLDSFFCLEPVSETDSTLAIVNSVKPAIGDPTFEPETLGEAGLPAAVLTALGTTFGLSANSSLEDVLASPLIGFSLEDTLVDPLNNAVSEGTTTISDAIGKIVGEPTKSCGVVKSEGNKK